MAEFLRISLGQATRHDQRFAAAGFAEPIQLEDRIDGLLLGLVDKPAGVDNQHIRLFGVSSQCHAIPREQAKHDFTVHEVFGAPETDQSDFNGSARLHFTGGSRVAGAGRVFVW